MRGSATNRAIVSKALHCIIKLHLPFLNNCKEQTELYKCSKTCKVAFLCLWMWLKITYQSNSSPLLMFVVSSDIYPTWWTSSYQDYRTDSLQCSFLLLILLPPDHLEAGNGSRQGMAPRPPPVLHRVPACTEAGEQVCQGWSFQDVWLRCTAGCLASIYGQTGDSFI